jgi:hypothetical protein
LPDGTIPRHSGRATLSLSTYQPNENSCTTSPPPSPNPSPARLDSTDSFRHLSFPLALYTLITSINNLRPAPRRGATDKRRGPFWFLHVTASMFFLSLSSTLCLLANNIFYFSRFFTLFSSQKGGTRLGVIMGLGMWALKPEKASTGWIGWKEGNREKEKRHFLIKSKKKKKTRKRQKGPRDWRKIG